jgi:hypothetical protein
MFLDVAFGVLLRSPPALPKRGAVPEPVGVSHSNEPSYQHGEKFAGDEEKRAMDASDGASVTLRAFAYHSRPTPHLKPLES